MYSEKVLEYFIHPSSVGTIENADGFGQAGGGPHCPEDVAYIWIQVENGRIVDARHKTIGCPVAIAASCMTCDLAKGKLLEEALEITPEQVAGELGGIPEDKKDSSVGPLALQKAIADYKKRMG